MREPAEPCAPLDDSTLVIVPVEAAISNASDCALDIALDSASDKPRTKLLSYDELLYADLHEAVDKLSESIMAELGSRPRRGFKKRRGSKMAHDEPDAV